VRNSGNAPGCKDERKTQFGVFDEPAIDCHGQYTERGLSTEGIPSECSDHGTGARL
jgi:hypothetical protein